MVNSADYWLSLAKSRSWMGNEFDMLILFEEYTHYGPVNPMEKLQGLYDILIKCGLPNMIMSLEAELDLLGVTYAYESDNVLKTIAPMMRGQKSLARESISKEIAEYEKNVIQLKAQLRREHRIVTPSSRNWKLRYIIAKLL